MTASSRLPSSAHSRAALRAPRSHQDSVHATLKSGILKFSPRLLPSLTGVAGFWLVSGGLSRVRRCQGWYGRGGEGVGRGVRETRLWQALFSKEPVVGRAADPTTTVLPVKRRATQLLKISRLLPFPRASISRAKSTASPEPVSPRRYRLSEGRESAHDRYRDSLPPLEEGFASVRQTFRGCGSTALTPGTAPTPACTALAP